VVQLYYIHVKDGIMKNITLIGAGLSTASIIPYIIRHLDEWDAQFLVCDRDGELAAQKLKVQGTRVKSMALDITDPAALSAVIEHSHVVISMVPAHMHMLIATSCLAHGAHMLTASYLTEAMQGLHDDAKKQGLVFLNECGLDPGIDHMSAMKLLDEVRARGGKVNLFESFTGGLLSPDSEKDNPWRYKFTWNPRNVVLAGQGGTVKFIQEGKYKYIPPHMVFRRTEFFNVEGYGRFEGLANRDSLKYRSTYGLDDISTLYRGTLRRPGYARAWQCFVKLGMTDDSFVINQTDRLSFRDFTNLFLAYNPYDSVELKLMHYLGIPQDSDLMEKLSWAGIFSNQKFPFERGTPAQCLEYILKQVWTLDPDDKDLIVMFHKIGWNENGELKMIESSMGTEGENASSTAMARTVGLPLAIATKLVITGVINTKGVQLPILPEWYDPILKELETDYNIKFFEKEVPYKGY
jgi:saccharopine dehydrogenase-like NADP-dependent oxidoreductase